MATPRIFVSSTCYDLQEIRHQLRNFINDFGYDAVMSEFDDIFYSYETHVQDSCLKEISKCQLFVLVVGNNYGSFYHQDQQYKKTPDSVTLREFKRALEAKIYKHIFINKYVDYDYKNYKRALQKVIHEHFQKNKIENINEESEIRRKIKIDFDKIYYFPYESYKYVFYFLDIINELTENNATSPFESFNDIKETLRKQWAGFMYESLTRKNEDTVSLILPLENKIDNIEKSLMKLIDSKTENSDNKITLDVSNLSRDLTFESLSKLQNKIENAVNNILGYYSEDDYGNLKLNLRMYFIEKFTNEMTEKWIESLRAIIQSYKLSKYISIEIIFEDFVYNRNIYSSKEVNYKYIYDLYSIYNSLEKDDKIILINTVTQYLNMSYQDQSSKNMFDDVPF